MNHFIAHWTSPSNIALIKYWGKLPGQIPANPSLSFTLNCALTNMKMELVKKESKALEISLDFFFEDKINEKFKLKISDFLTKQIHRFQWLTNYHIIINSFNTFPHSSGIASSASSMSALALCLCDLDNQINPNKNEKIDFFQKASEVAREASGSAARSVFPFMASWGNYQSGSSDLWATPLLKESVHPHFQEFCDSIVIVDGAEKAVSSRAGHALMDSHPFKEIRYQRAKHNTHKLIDILKNGDLNSFIEIVEEEALTLHGLMMTSSPSVLLLRPESLEVIHKLRSFRNETQITICFTIDAGPNIHILYPQRHKEKVSFWMEQNLSKFKIIHDEVGTGPKNLEPRVNIS